MNRVSLTPEQRARKNANERAKYHARSEAEKKALSAKNNERYHRMSPEEKADRHADGSRKRRVKLAQLPEEEQKLWRRNREYAKNYGITVDDYDQILEGQGGGCAICGSKDSRTNLSDYFFVDHDHETGAVRGLLCGPCNTGLGHLKDSVDNLESAIRYLNAANMGRDARGAA